MRHYKNTSDAGDRGPRRLRHWTAERVLLACLLSVGLLGLIMTYGSREAVHRNAAALPDSLRRASSPGIGPEAQTRLTTQPDRLRFEAADTVYVGTVDGQSPQ